VGYDGDGDQIVVMEAKFWAGLTDNQPVQYVERLPDEKPALLLFLAPATRLRTLWPELRRRMMEGGRSLGADRWITSDLVHAAINDRHWLALTSWSSSLRVVKGELEGAGEHENATDVRQLQGLCARMDSEAFLPLTGQDLASTGGRRILDFCRLIDDGVSTLRHKGLVSTKGLRATGGSGFYTRYITLVGIGCALGLYSDLWSRRAETPIWLKVWGPRGEGLLTEEITQRLAPLMHEDPPRLFVGDDVANVPIWLPTGVEFAGALGAVVSQVEAVADLLRGGAA
jgi:hypothetical protein